MAIIKLLLLFMINSLNYPCHVVFSFTFPSVSISHLNVRKADLKTIIYSSGIGRKYSQQLSRLFSLDVPLQNQVVIKSDNSLVNLNGNYNATSDTRSSITTQGDDDIHIHPLNALERDVSFVIHNLTSAYDNTIYPCK